VSTRWSERKEKVITKKEAIAHRSETPRWRPLARHMPIEIAREVLIRCTPSICF
jgi:hypothetical protein